MNNFLKYGATGGAIAGGAYGLIGQAKAKRYDPQASTSFSGYAANVARHAPIGLFAGMGAAVGFQEIAKAISKS